MRDSIGSALLLYIVIIVVGIVGATVIASNMYTKAYRVKNSIIEIIDKYYSTHSADIGSTPDCFDHNDCINEINKTVDEMKYTVAGDTSVCDSASVKKKIQKDEKNLEFIYPREPNKFRGYCIFKKTLDDTNLNKYEYYYVVVTFSRLNVGVSNVGTIFKRPVSGETKIYYLY